MYQSPSSCCTPIQTSAQKGSHRKYYHKINNLYSFIVFLSVHRKIIFYFSVSKLTLYFDTLSKIICKIHTYKRPKLYKLCNYCTEKII